MTVPLYYQMDIPMGNIGESWLSLLYWCLCTLCQQLSRAAYQVVLCGLRVSTIHECVTPVCGS